MPVRGGKVGNNVEGDGLSRDVHIESMHLEDFLKIGLTCATRFNFKKIDLQKYIISPKYEQIGNC